MITPTPTSTQTPAAAPARKPASPKTDAGAEGNTKMISVRLTSDQIARVEQWRALYGGLDFGASVRVLIGLGLKARPREIVDPLGLASATHVRRPGKAKT